MQIDRLGGLLAKPLQGICQRTFVCQKFVPKVLQQAQTLLIILGLCSGLKLNAKS